MIKIYYYIWSNAIIALHKKYKKELSWHEIYLTLIVISLTQILHYLPIHLCLITLYDLDISINIIIFESKKINTFSESIVIINLIVLINYYFVFFKKKYLKIIKKYPPKNSNPGDFVVKYFIISALICFTLFIPLLFILEYIKYGHLR